jgi:hypothetical protein
MRNHPSPPTTNTAIDGVRRFVVKVLVNIGSLLWLVLATGLVALRLKRRRDGWRSLTAVGLRSEASKPALTALGLDLWSDQRETCRAVHPSTRQAEQHFLKRLIVFLESEAYVHRAVIWRRWRVEVITQSQVDIVLGIFDQSGHDLKSIEPLLDRSYSDPDGLDEMQRRQLDELIVQAYNRSRETLDIHRAHATWRVFRSLLKQLRRPRHVRRAGERYGRRVLSGCFVSVEQLSPDQVDAHARFSPPDFRHRCHLGYGLLNVAARLSPDGGSVDVWVQIHHAGADGVPMQALMNRLKTQWGIRDDLRFPSDGAFARHAVPRPCSGVTSERLLHNLSDFMDFAPLLRCRKSLNERLKSQLDVEASVGCLLLWCLAHQPEFAGEKFASTVEVPARDDEDQSVSLVVIRPADHMIPDNPTAGVGSFARAFDRQMQAARQRKSDNYRATSMLALLPSMLQSLSLRCNLERTRQAFGSVGLTILKDAALLVAPMADVAVDGGFIVIGSMGLPCADGGTVGFVNIKGFAERIKDYPDAIRRAIARCNDYV